MKRNIRDQLIWLAIAVGGWLVIDLLTLVGIISPFILTIITMIEINVILAVSLNLILGVSGQFSLGHAGFMAIGAYASAIVAEKSNSIWGFALGILIGMAISGIIALIEGIPTLRLRGDYLAIATLGVSEIIRITINNLEITNGPKGIFNIPAQADWSIVYIFAAVITMVIVNLVHSKTGRAILSVRDNEIAAASLGINTTKFKVIAFVVGAVAASVAGSLYATYLQSITPSNFSFMQSISTLIIVVLGGVGSITGSILAAVVLGFVDIILQNYGALRMVLYSLMLIAFMLFRPSGFLGTWEFSISRLFSAKNKSQKESK
ncbi:branched-chain amino acid ABC transporter permease [Xylocopilactobacillus apicola]|uniref:Branched-chain amino acid ABC transporter permease n=1 Tax=Xylocopilactobacillus apicola TaxID=2932184 RepID=A0AAU9CV63_9LACO|nr:branched-chain amino acid ABC transporter permease [Xylocopilactobacillus apicola]BDR57884.1 branched-chain amino acid ABC transporter permease [Xylocopilactobacillus apicola]